MPVSISEDLKKKYLDYFKNEAKFKIPFRDPYDFNVHEHFFDNLYYARESLVTLLNGVSFPVPIHSLEPDVYTEFTITSHAKVRGAPGQQVGVEISKGQSGLMLAERGIEKAISQHRTADSDSLVITSHLARAIHHAILKYYPEPGLQDELESVADKIEAEMRRNNGGISRDTLVNLVEHALDRGIIPTPLLGSHYHGVRDLHPEKPEQFDMDNFFATELCKIVHAGKPKGKVRSELERLQDLAKNGRDVFQFVEDEDGKTLTENMLLYAHRVAYLLKLFSPGNKGFYKSLKGKKINLVGHSSNIDVICAYFRHFGEPWKLILEKAEKSKTRGKEIVTKVDSKFNYLNDPQKIEEIRDLSLKTAYEQRKASLDEKIREARKKEHAIIPVELLRFEKKQEPNGRAIYEPHSISVDDILKSPEPALWLANFGQGKSTATIELIEKLNTNGQYVGVLVTARDINEGLLNALGKDPTRNDEIILDLLSKDTASLSNILRDEYKFVFIVDALDEVTNYRENVIHVAKDTGQLKEYGKVIVTSRFTGFDQYENPGFTTLHLDPQAVLRNIDSYLELRITNQAKRKEFEDFLRQQDEAIKTNYLLVYFLTNIYNKRPSELGGLKKAVSEGEILIRGIEIALWDYKLTKGSIPEIPKPYAGQAEEEARVLTERYETIRKNHLNKWMDLLQRVASYMTVHDKRTVTRPEIEQVVSSGWTLGKYVSELKGR